MLAPIPAGAVSVIVLPADAGFIVGKAGPEPYADQRARIAADGRAARGYCAGGVAGGLSAAQIRKLIEDAQKSPKTN